MLKLSNKKVLVLVFFLLYFTIFQNVSYATRHKLRNSRVSKSNLFSTLTFICYLCIYKYRYISKLITRKRRRYIIKQIRLNSLLLYIFAKFVCCNGNSPFFLFISSFNSLPFVARSLLASLISWLLKIIPLIKFFFFSHKVRIITSHHSCSCIIIRIKVISFYLICFPFPHIITIFLTYLKDAVVSLSLYFISLCLSVSFSHG